MSVLLFKYLLPAADVKFEHQPHRFLCNLLQTQHGAQVLICHYQHFPNIKLVSESSWTYSRLDLLLAFTLDI